MAIEPLARKSTLAHPLGFSIETPLLVPSFSSKGFRRTAKDVSEVSEILEKASDVLTDCVLVSAYDTHHGFLPRIDKLPCSADLTIIDSGGYETADDHDISSVIRSPEQIKEWSEKRYRSVLKAWPAKKPAIVVSYDHGGEFHKLKEQIRRARDLFSAFPNQLNCFLIKPETAKDRFLDIDEIAEVSQSLSAFRVIGVTEKEIGDAPLERMRNIARVRRALDRAGVTAPIHIFGSLEPFTSLLYFLAGAEIFDGLTWLRYAFVNGDCSYVMGASARATSLEQKDSLVRAQILGSNLMYLKALRLEMKRFLIDSNFESFRFHAETLKHAHSSMHAMLT